MLDHIVSVFFDIIFDDDLVSGFVLTPCGFAVIGPEKLSDYKTPTPLIGPNHRPAGLLSD